MLSCLYVLLFLSVTNFLLDACHRHYSTFRQQSPFNVQQYPNGLFSLMYRLS